MAEKSDTPVQVHLKLRSFETDLVLPPGSDVLRTEEPEALFDVHGAVRQALASPIGARPLADLGREVLGRNKPLEIRTLGGIGQTAGRPAWVGRSSATGQQRSNPSVVVVVSDNTRAVPHKGKEGILWPLTEALMQAGFSASSITFLVATGTHRVLTDEEMWALIDERARAVGTRVRCHDASEPAGLTFVGRTAAGDDVFMDTAYVEADFRVLTGMVEVHLLAGVSGGRKSLCPGLVDVRSVRGFHGPEAVAHPKATALVLEGNPSHAVALEVAHMAEPDFILNVTTRQDGRVAGVFAGDMEQAHLAAVEHLRSFVQIPLQRRYDVVVTHGGMVGVNHYQAEKAYDIGVRAVRPEGYMVSVADTTEPDPIGTASYRRLLVLLKELGPEGFMTRLRSKEWEFAHDQWAAQSWAQLFAKVPSEHIFYYSPQTPPEDYVFLPGVDPATLMAGAPGGASGDLVRYFVTAAVKEACADSEARTGRPATVAFLADGPHGVPVPPPESMAD